MFLVHPVVKDNVLLSIYSNKISSLVVILAAIRLSQLHFNTTETNMIHNLIMELLMEVSKAGSLLLLLLAPLLQLL